MVTEREILVRSNAAERARIVRSPERLKQKNADLVESAEALKPQIAGVESTLKSHRAKMTTLYNVHNVGHLCIRSSPVQLMVISTAPGRKGRDEGPTALGKGVRVSSHQGEGVSRKVEHVHRENGSP